MADIFLSYVRSDAKRAKQIADALAARGWSVWWDTALTPGVRFRDKIAEQLHAARCVVVLWSKASLDSDFVIDEAEDGKRRGVLVQVLIEDVRPPHGFRQIQAAMLMGWDGSDSGEFERLCAGISAYAPLSESAQYESSTYAGQQAALSEVSLAAYPARIVWKPIPTGLAIEVTNRQPQVMKTVQLVLTDMRWWNPEINDFVESLDAHGSQGFALHGTGQLFSGIPAMFVFIRWSPGDTAIRIDGVAPTPQSSPPKLRLTGKGRWSVGLELKWDGGEHEQGLQFFWAGMNAPVPLPGPPRQITTPNDQPSLSTAGPHPTPEQWKGLEQKFKDLNDATLCADLWTKDLNDRNDWRVHGGSEKSRHDFMVLAEFAGALLPKSGLWRHIAGSPDIREAPDHVHRWLCFLRYKDKKHYATTIDALAVRSVFACMLCSETERRLDS